ncbi:hif1an, partial [Symbiodinium sp. CCMP2456]
VCARCKAARYCGPACQRAGWKAGHKEVCGQPAETTSWPVRCPASLLRGQLPRLERLDSAEAQAFLCEGQAFVAPAEGLLGTRLSQWDFKYLEKHLPETQRYGVMLDEGSGKIVMSHSARNGQRQIDVSEPSRQRPAAEGNSDEGLFSTSDQTRMTFADFLAEARRFRAAGGKRKLPYFGIHLLWRFKEEENGFLGPIGPEMADDLWSIHFDVIKEWQEMNVLPLVQRFYLFAGLGGTLYHCHYDLQPNLHVQLTGRKRFILFPPEDWRHLYPFPVHHDLDRRSMVDLDAPDCDRFPGWQNAKGYMVELEPGEALYIPPYWWHHVQSLTPETTSMAMWFFEHYPLSSGVSYGVGPRCEDVVLMRDIEEYIGKHFPDAPGEEDCTKARPIKAKQVAAFARWMLPRLGAAGEQPQPPPGLTMAAEEVEKKLFKLLADRDVREPKEKIRSLLSRRF